MQEWSFIIISNQLINDIEIAFSPDGLIGWISMLTNRPTGLPYTSNHPVLYKTTDGGATWTGPIEVQLGGAAGLEGVKQFVTNEALANLYNPGPVPNRDQIPYFMGYYHNFVVDAWGNPHLHGNVMIADLATGSIFTGSSFNAPFHIWSSDGGSTWQSYKLSDIKQFMAEFYGGGSTVYHYNQNQISNTPDGTIVFFSWIDSDLPDAITNNYPDIYFSSFVPYEGANGIHSNPENVTVMSNAMWNANWATMPERVFAEAVNDTTNECTIPWIYQDLNGNHDPSAPVQFKYIADFKKNYTIPQSTILTVTPYNQYVSSYAGVTNITVFSTIEWSISESLNWLSVESSSGTGNETIVVNYDVNTSSEPRTGSKKIAGPDNNPFRVVWVTQAGLMPLIAYSVSGGGVYCEGTIPTGVNIGLSGSQLGVNYQLKSNGVGIGQVLSGKGSSLIWNNIGAGTYSIDAYNGFDSIAMSGVAVITEMPLVPVNVSIMSDANDVCQGTEVTFTAIPDNQGENPVYQWNVNGNFVAGNSSTFSYVPVNNDVVFSVLTSDLGCTSGNPATSNTITTWVHPLPTVTWPDFQPDTLCIFWEPVPLYGGLPVGGTYIGAGIENGYFYPSVAEFGEHTIFYTFTDANMCYAEASRSLFVDYCTTIPDIKNHKYH